jgi:hypothetical protein
MPLRARSANNFSNWEGVWFGWDPFMSVLAKKAPHLLDPP